MVGVLNGDIEQIIEDLESIVSYRTRYFTLVSFCSDYYYLQLSLLFIDEIRVVDGVLLLCLSNGLRYELLLCESTSVSYVTDEPLTEDEKRKKKIRRGV